MKIIYFRQKHFRGLGARAGWVALTALVAACNAPNSSGLFTPFRPEGAGAGGVPASAGASNSEGGSAGSAGNTAVGGSGGSGGSGGTSAGAGGSPAGGTGGTDADAGSDDAGLTLDATVDAGPTCAGAPLYGICWYVGASDQSCNQVCANRGGFNAAATSVIGTPAQGGNIENCSALMLLLLGNEDDAVIEGTQVAGNGAGCHLFDAPAGQRWWLTTPDFSPDVALVGGRLVCGCND